MTKGTGPDGLFTSPALTRMLHANQGMERT
jgi:hypothetical protein